MTPRRRYVSQCSAPIVFLLKDKNSDQQAPDEANQECHYLAGLLELDISGAGFLALFDEGSIYEFALSRKPGGVRTVLPPASLMASFWSVQKLLLTDPSVCRVSSLGVDEAEAKRYTAATQQSNNCIPYLARSVTLPRRKTAT